MSGRHGYEAPRRNDYFIPGEGISREVIQADICRYLGNDALVKPGTYNGHSGFLLHAYRNLTSEMIADLKNDSARWQAESMRRAEQGYPRAHYQNSDTHMGRQHYGPSSPYGPPVGQSIVDPHAAIQYVSPQPPHGSTQSPQYQPQTYTSGNSSFPPGPNQYVQQMSYPGHGQVPSSSDPPQGYPAYTWSNSPAYHETARNNPPRYTGPGYEPDQDFPSGFSPGTSGGGYPATSVPDPRADQTMDPTGMHTRYTPESMYDRNNRQQPTRPERRR